MGATLPMSGLSGLRRWRATTPTAAANESLAVQELRSLAVLEGELWQWGVAGRASYCIESFKSDLTTGDVVRKVLTDLVRAGAICANRDVRHAEPGCTGVRRYACAPAAKKTPFYSSQTLQTRTQSRSKHVDDKMAMQRVLN